MNKVPNYVFLALLAISTTGCSTTSGSTRLDQTGQGLSPSPASAVKPQDAAFYIQALRGGLVGRLSNLHLQDANRARALEAEYRALETAPAGQSVVWESDGTRGEVVAAVPYQVGSQNCRQYTHTVTVGNNAPLIARGAACRNANGSWTPLT